MLEALKKMLGMGGNSADTNASTGTDSTADAVTDANVPSADVPMETETDISTEQAPTEVMTEEDAEIATETMESVMPEAAMNTDVDNTAGVSGDGMACPKCEQNPCACGVDEQGKTCACGNGGCGC